MTFISETRRYYPTLWDPRYDFRGNKKLESQVWETMAPPGARSTPVMSERIILSRSELRLTRFLSSHKPTAPPGHINPVLHNKKGRINTFLWPHLLNNQIENVYKQKYVDVDQVIRCFFKSVWPVLSSKVFFWWKENGLLDVFVLLISKNCWIRSACKKGWNQTRSGLGMLDYRMLSTLSF